MLQDGLQWLMAPHRKPLPFTLNLTFADPSRRIYEEYQNTGAGASTASRVMTTKATAAVTKSQLWSGDASWYDTSY